VDIFHPREAIYRPSQRLARAAESSVICDNATGERFSRPQVPRLARGRHFEDLRRDFDSGPHLRQRPRPRGRDQTVPEFKPPTFSSVGHPTVAKIPQRRLMSSYGNAGGFSSSEDGMSRIGAMRL